MASIAKSLGRPALFLARRGQIISSSRSFSASPFSFAQKTPQPTRERPPRPEELPPAPEYSPDLLNEQERSMYDKLPPEEREEFDAENRRIVEEFNDPEKRKKIFADLDKQAAEIERATPMRFEDQKPRGGSNFWSADEDDEFADVEDADDTFYDDDIPSMAHAELEVHREVREYARIAAWDMPMLSKFAQPFTLPPETHILRFRYTTYMGESHPAEPKVVMELCSKDLTPKYLTEAQRLTFLKLVGPRYNPETDIVRMSCEKFPARAQNKRYLGDLINTLVKEAKEGDSFADIPLDLRHHTPSKPKTPFPDSWNMTEERKKQLEAKRAERQQSQRPVVDGNEIAIQAAKAMPTLKEPVDSARQRVPVGARLFGRRAR
ncbi:37S ribosomal protein Rsm24 [Aspergillus sclerotialis]|uniref:37S ribosomal protein Rsm24 n=1 Tax=Aspergillus sclerotialis TaxID=2070753 RepID=A0A3A2ZMY7_9EURO|nr:37S ribosomal protein Rsm24 [Aspergillus sclerotialis]